MSLENNLINVRFAGSPVVAKLSATVHKRYLLLDVVALDGADIYTFTFVDIPLTPPGASQDAFVGCALALNLETNVTEIPQPSKRLRGMCYRRFGFVGAQVALIGCPLGDIRSVM